MMLKKGMEKAVEAAVTGLQEMSKKVEEQKDIEMVATNSADSSEIGKLIAHAMEVVGNDGIITVEEAKP